MKEENKTELKIEFDLKGADIDAPDMETNLTDLIIVKPQSEDEPQYKAERIPHEIRGTIK